MKAKFFILFILIQSLSLAQPYHQDVFKGTMGDELFSSLVQNYKPAMTMTYGMARDTLYSIIDSGPDNTLEGIYSGFTITLDPLLDPTTDAFNKGINAEHSYPQSKGAGDGPGRSDMHHLYPSKVEVNSDRQSYPYGEIIDSNTDFWYYNDIKSGNIPTNNIDNYSELDLNGNDSRFEPRESVKGNIARGIFYFYTMYREEAINADPEFFEIQKADLCAWHFADPVDESEWKRSLLIGKYQENKPNPFVLDCSLASRLYCDQTSAACELLTHTKDIFTEKISFSNLYPNPVSESNISVNVLSEKTQTIHIIILDPGQKLLHQELISINSQGPNTLSFPTPEEKGIYFVLFRDEDGITTSKKFVKI